MSDSKDLNYAYAMNYSLAILGSISALLSFAVVLTCLAFASMRKRPFMRMIAIMSFCDMMMGITNSFNFFFPVISGNLCYAQAIIYSSFSRALGFWMLVMAYQLYAVVSRELNPLSVLAMNLIGWGIPLLFELSIALSDTGFQRTRSDLITVCFIQSSPGESFAETVSIFILNTTVAILLCISPIIYLYWKIMKYVNTTNPDDTRILEGVKSLYIYPIVLPICYSPVLLVGIAYFSSHFRDKLILDIMSFCYLLYPIYGIIVSIVFFCKSEAARYHWTQIFRNKNVDLIYFEQLSSKNEDSSVDESITNRMSQISLLSTTESSRKKNLSRDSSYVLHTIGIGFTSDRTSLSSKLLDDENSVQLSQNTKNNRILSADNDGTV